MTELLLLLRRGFGFALAGLGLLGPLTLGLGQAAVLLRLVGPALPLALLAGRQEVRFQVAQLVAMGAGPLGGGGEPGAGVEVAVLLIGIGRRPFPGGVGETVAGGMLARLSSIHRPSSFQPRINASWAISTVPWAAGDALSVVSRRASQSVSRAITRRTRSARAGSARGIRSSIGTRRLVSPTPSPGWTRRRKRRLQVSLSSSCKVA